MDNYELVTKYLKEGYIALVEYDDSYDEVMAINLSKKEFKNFIFMKNNSFIKPLIKEGNKYILIKSEEIYEIKIKDILNFLNKEIKLLEKEKVSNLSGVIYLINRYNKFIFPNLSKENLANPLLFNDFTFEKDVTLIYFIFSFFKNERCTLKDLLNLRSFILNILENRKLPLEKRNYLEYSLETILNLYNEVSNLDDSLKIERNISFYKKNILELALKENITALTLIGYDYYLGINGFKLSKEDALKYLTKSFELKPNAYTADTIGYIHYYGNTKDEAFKYFAYGHFENGVYESTYKLADCYLNGYGTFKSEKAAYNLVKSIYEENREYYLKVDDSKYADIAYRLGTYYLKGIGCEKDPNIALNYLLEARNAIKLRLKSIDYVGDKSVALNIFKAIEETKKELTATDRKIIKNGYLIKRCSFYWSNVDIKLIPLKDNYYKIIIKQNPEDEGYFIGGDESIFYSERTKIVEYLIKSNDINQNDFNKKITSIEITSRYIDVTFSDNDELMFYVIDKLIYLPQNIKNIKKDYYLAFVNRLDDNSQDICLVKKENKVDEIIKLKDQTRVIKAKIINIYSLYEDELPLPNGQIATIIE